VDKCAAALWALLPPGTLSPSNRYPLSGPPPYFFQRILYVRPLSAMVSLWSNARNIRADAVRTRWSLRRLPIRPEDHHGVERPLSVDHNHRSGENRGLLCDSCNLILGLAKDSQELLRRLIVYLQKHDGANFEFVETNPETASRRKAEWQRSLSEL